MSTFLANVHFWVNYSFSSVCVGLYESQNSGPALNSLRYGKQNLARNTSIGHKMTFFSFQFACLWWRLRLMWRQLKHVYSENLPHLTDLHSFPHQTMSFINFNQMLWCSSVVAQIKSSVFILLKISDHTWYSSLLIEMSVVLQIILLLVWFKCVRIKLWDVQRHTEVNLPAD